MIAMIHGGRVALRLIHNLGYCYQYALRRATFDQIVVTWLLVISIGLAYPLSCVVMCASHGVNSTAHGAHNVHQHHSAQTSFTSETPSSSVIFGAELVAQGEAGCHMLMAFDSGPLAQTPPVMLRFDRLATLMLAVLLPMITWARQIPRARGSPPFTLIELAPPLRPPIAVA